MDDKISVLDDKEVLKVDSGDNGDGYKPSWIYLMALDCILNNDSLG